MDQQGARMVPERQVHLLHGHRPGMPAEQIYVMRADGSEQTPLTDGPFVSAEATFRRVRPPVNHERAAATPNVLWPANGRMIRRVSGARCRLG